MIFGGAVPVLCFHRLGRPEGPSPEWFAALLDWLVRDGWTTLSVAELLAVVDGARPAGKSVVLTFDDGWLDNWLLAAPLLAERGLKAAFFVVTDFIGDGEARREAPGPAASAREAFRLALAGDRRWFMNRAELKRLADMGMDVLPHSAAHAPCFRNLRGRGAVAPDSHWAAWAVYGERPEGRPLFDIGSAYAYDGFWPVRPEPADQADAPLFRRRSPENRYRFCLEDLARSRRVVEDITGRPADVLCWPWGDFDDLSVRAAKEAGFRAAFTLERGANAAGLDPFRLKRLAVGPTKSLAWLKRRLRVYRSPLLARLAAKPFRKRPEAGTVLYVTDTPKTSGGSRQMLNNALAMRQAGLRAILACPPDSQIQAAALAADLEIATSPDLGRVRPAARFLRELTRREGVDVVHTFHTRSVKSALLARLTGGRFRLFFNRGVLFAPNPLTALWALLSGGGVICNSQACRRMMGRFLVPDRLTHVVYNAFVPTAPTALESVDASGAGGRPRVVYAGNNKPHKGLDVFLRAAEAYLAQPGLPEAEFVVVNGDPARFVGAVSDETLRRVSFRGFTPHAALLALLTGSAAYLFTSREGQDSLPNTVLEAFSAGLPVVATRVGGLAELIADGQNGYLVESEDVQGLADRLARLLADPVLARAMGERSAELVREHFSLRRKGFHLLRVYCGEHVAAPAPSAALTAPRPLSSDAAPAPSTLVTS